MVFSLNIVILLLQVLQCKGAVSVQQDHLIQTAFANEQVNTTCKATFPYKPEYLQFQIIYYRIDSTGNEVTVNTLPVSEMIPPGQENNTATKTYHLHIKPTAHASITDTYYCKAQWHKEIREGFGTFILFRDKGYTEPLFTMLVCLVVITIILAVLSIMGTALLFWKRQDLEPRQSGVYFVIKKDKGKSSFRKMPAAEVSQQETQREISDIVYENL